MSYLRSFPEMCFEWSRQVPTAWASFPVKQQQSLCSARRLWEDNLSSTGRVQYLLVAVLLPSLPRMPPLLACLVAVLCRPLPCGSVWELARPQGCWGGRDPEPCRSGDPSAPPGLGVFWFLSGRDGEGNHSVLSTGLLYTV